MNIKSKLYISCLLILTLFCSTIFSACSVITSENLSSSNENLSNSSSNNSITNTSSNNNDSSQHSESSTTSNSNTSTNSSSSNSDVSNTSTPSSDSSSSTPSIDNSSTSTPSSEPIKKVTITFNSNGGTNCDSITQEVGSALTLPQPTKTDYDFVGWYTQNEINENYLFDSKVMPNEDITLYAGWELQDNIYMNDYLSAKNFEEWKSTSTYDVDDYIVIRYFSDEVDVTSKSQYNLNTGINVLQDGYILNWYKDKDFKDNLATQKDYLKYGDNVYFATITTSSGQFVSAYAVNIYVYHDYTYTYYEYQPGYKFASQMGMYSTQAVSESKIIEPLTISNGYTFKEWVTSDNEPFDFSKPIGLTGNLKLYATYEDVELNIAGDKITYSPYLTTNLPIKESTEGHFFDGYYSNGVQYFDENGNAITPLPFEATKTIEYGYSEYTQEKYFEFSKVEGGYSLSLKEMPSYTTTILIPKEYNNEPIIAIDEFAFSNFYEITKIIIQNSVTSMGKEAFRNCSSLTTVTIDKENQLQSIGERAFQGCSSLENITIPTSVTSIGESAFNGCSSLESITIPFVGAKLNGSSNTHFGYIFGASSYSENSTYVPTTLKEVIITGGNSIGKEAFAYCSSLESIVIPASVTSIGERAFAYCSSLVIYCEASSKPSGWSSDWNYSNRPVYWGINENNYKEENGLRYVIQDGNTILTRYVGNETTIEIPNTVQINGTIYNVTSIGDYAFYGCYSLERIVIPNSVKSIGECAFQYCYSLERIEIPASVTSIGDRAFSGCSSLESIVIPNSVTSIGAYAFSGCSSLIIYCEANSQPSGWTSGWTSYWNSSNRPVYWEGQWHYDENGNPVRN